MYGTLAQRVADHFVANRGVGFTVAELAKAVKCSKSPQLYRMLHEACAEGKLVHKWGTAYGRPARVFYLPEEIQPYPPNFEPQGTV